MHTRAGGPHPGRWVEGPYQTDVDVEGETEARGTSPPILFLWTEGPTWGCRGFQDPRAGAAAGLGRVRSGAEGGRGGDRLFGRAVWFLHLLRAQVHFDGPLRALQIYLQVFLEEGEARPWLWAAAHLLMGQRTWTDTREQAQLLRWALRPVVNTCCFCLPGPRPLL